MKLPSNYIRFYLLVISFNIMNDLVDFVLPLPDIKLHPLPLLGGLLLGSEFDLNIIISSRTFLTM